VTRIFLACLLSGIIGLTSSVYACGPEANTPEKLKTRQEEGFRRMDIDHDGYISRLEFSRYADWEISSKQPRELFFSSLDTNNDKFLNFFEWAKGFPLRNFKTKGC
jgi:Ca2+-binding EF-hand superfamily protein